MLARQALYYLNYAPALSALAVSQIGSCVFAQG
jgi:hypothetical protein